MTGSAKQSIAVGEAWIASSQVLLAMTALHLHRRGCLKIESLKNSPR